MRTRFFALSSPVAGIFALLASLASPAQADKTLMWLTDWYQGNLDSAVITQVSIPHYGDTGAAAQGYYYGKTDLVLSPTNAYAPQIRVNTTYNNTGKPDSLTLPKTLTRAWYVQPGFNQGNFRGGMVNVMMNFRSFNHRYQQGPPPKIQMDTGKGTGQTGQLNQSSSTTPGFLDNCVNNFNSDTIWIRMPAPDSVINPGYTGDKLVCTDHNPFFVKVGTIHVYNPWPGKSLFVQQGGAWYPLYPEPGRLGWQTTTLWANPSSDTTFKIRVANAKPTGTTVGVQYLDAQGFSGAATGPAFDFTATPGGERWILPPTSTGATPTVVKAAPPVRTILMIQRPHWGASGVRVLWKGSDARYIAGSTQYCEWYGLPLYEGAIPDSIVLQHPLADTLYGTGNQVKTPVPMSSFTGWIVLKGKIAVGDTTWLVTPNVSGASIVPRPGAQLTTCNTKILAFSAYDYADGLTSTSPYFYAPFAETNSGVVYPAGQNKGKITDNCPDAGGGATKGLVRTTLDANGRPIWSGKIDCDIGTAQQGPGNWFDPLTVNGTQLNAFKCVPLTLTLDPSDGYYKYYNGAFFPLNQATSVPYGPATGTNFHFAMHAKASFEYVRGLTFKFKGDDDVWIFIDKKLALDLGGQHGEMPGEIDLDKLGLVEGKSYQFDMFYSERHQTGSDLGIQTTMNLVPTVDVVFDTTGSVGNSRDIRVKTIETTLDPSKCPEEGSTTQRKELPGRSNIYLIHPDGTQEEIDTLKYVSEGLSVTEMFSHIAIDTNRLRKSPMFPESGTYTILISIGTEEMRASFTVVTAYVNGHGTMFDRDGDGRADSAFIHGDGLAPAFQKAFLAKLRWADSLGVSDTARPLVSGMLPVPKDSAIALTFAPLPERTSCPPEGCIGAMGLVWGIAANGDTVKNRIVELADGIAPVADSAWMIYDTTGLAKDTLYVRSSEPLSAFAGPFPSGDSAFALTGRRTSPAPVKGTGILVGDLLKLAIDPATNPIQPGDSIRLGGYSGDASGNAPGARSKWVPLYATAVARSWMLDRDGDGAPDSVGVASKGSLGTATSVVVNWKTAAGFDTALTIALPTGIVNGFPLPAGVLKDATGCSGCRLDVTIGGKVRSFALVDSVAPVAIQADLIFGSGSGDPDTLRIKPSESIVARGTGTWAQLAADSGSNTGLRLKDPMSVQTIAPTGELVLVVASGSGIDGMIWARFGQAVLDVRGNAVGTNSKWVPLRITPAARSWMYDRDGDGAPDSVIVSSKGSLATATGAKVHWKTASGSDTTLTVALPTGIVKGFQLPPNVLQDATCCTGCTLDVTIGGLVRSFQLLDSVPPVAISGSLVFGANPGDADTVRIKPSETISAATAGVWAQLATDSGSTTGVDLSQANSVETISVNGELVLVVKSGSGLDGMAWVRLRQAVSDARGNFVGTRSKWVRLSVTPSARSWMLDRNGDGAPDSVGISSKGSLAAATGAVVHWKTVQGLDTSLAVSLPTGIVNGFPLPAGVLKDATSCTGCTLEVTMGGQVRIFPLLDSVAPVALDASLIFGFAAGDADTLRIKPSEAILASGAGTWAILATDSGSTTGTSLSKANAAQTISVNGELVLVVPSGSGLDAMAWVRFGQAVSDARGNAVGDNSKWVRLHVKPSGRAALYDADGDGRADSMFVAVRGGISATRAILHWKTASGAADSRTWVVAPSTGSFGVRAADASQRFDFGATSCTGCTVELQDAQGASLVEWPLADSVAPVLLEGRYRFGATQDTLVATFSEPVTGVSRTATWLEWGKTVVGGPVAQTDVTASGSSATFLLDPAHGAAPGWDSLRLAAGSRAGNVVDASGKAVGATSPWAPIRYGVAPFQAWLLDPAGAGRGTHVRVSLARPVPATAVAVLDSFRLQWTSADGAGLDARSVATSSLAWDGVSSWTGPLSVPFATGRTACAGACTAEGIARNGDRGLAKLQDSIPPAAIRARLRYSTPEVAQDTLIVDLSEDWAGNGSMPLDDTLVWAGSHANVRNVLPLKSWSLVDGRSLRLVFGPDISSRFHQGDSARLAWLASGSKIQDGFGNLVGIGSPWVPVEFGLRPPMFVVGPYRSVLNNSSTVPGVVEWPAPPASNPQVEILERLPDGSFGKVDGSGGGVAGGSPVNDTAHCIGIDIRVNRPLDGVMIIYDNLGTMVVSQSLNALKELWNSKQDQERTIRIQWNATGSDHRLVGSGVYVVRVVARIQDNEGHQDIRNQIWKLGFHRKMD